MQVAQTERPKSFEADLDIERAREGDAQALQELVQRHSRAVFKLAYRITRNEEDAEDTVQETFIRVFKKLGTFEARSEFSTWLYRVAANTAIDVVRRRRRFDSRSTSLDEAVESGRPPRSEAPGPERLVFGQQIEDRVNRAMGQLTDVERAAFTLRHFEECSTAEIGEALGLTSSAAKHAVFRAVKKLRRSLGSVRGAETGGAP